MNQLQPKLEFKLDEKNEMLPYDTQYPRPDNIIHIGQRKLFLSELRFLTDHGMSDQGRVIVIYVGAASGQHISLIRDLFPHITFLLFDGAPFRISGRTTQADFYRLDDYMRDPRPGLYLFNELFYDYHARVLETSFRRYLTDEDRVLLISDIRTADPGEDATYDYNVLMDLAMQYHWVKIIDVDKCMLKFRYPFYEYSPESVLENVRDVVMLTQEDDINFIQDYRNRTVTYLDGELWPQAFPGVTSSEVRLVSSGKNLKNYGPKTIYEETLFGYNMLNRPREHVNEYADPTIGFDHCGDCSIESWTWRHYFEKIGWPSEGTHRDVVIDHVNQLSRVSRRLLERDHGRLGFTEEQLSMIPSQPTQRSSRRERREPLPTTQQSSSRRVRGLLPTPKIPASRGRRDMSRPTPREFYDRDRTQTRSRREQSPVYDLRALNNFLKTSLINRYTPRGATVVDLGGGRGGDLRKYLFARAGQVILTDISTASLDEAEKRYNQLLRRNPNMFSLELVEVDSSDSELIHELKPSDLVSSQFHLHYVFDTDERAAQTIKTIADTLKPGGHLVITIPNAEYIQSRLVDGRMGNDIFSIEMTGDRSYTFYLEDSIDHVEEYLVPREEIMRLAEDNGLILEYERTFNEFVLRDLNESEKSLLPKMVQNAYKSSRFIPIGSQEWDVFKLYKIMVFKKTSESVIESLWNDREGRRSLERFIQSTSLIRSNPQLYDGISQILDRTTSDIEGYSDLREYLEDVQDESIFGVFNLETWNRRAQARARRISELLPDEFRPTSLLDLGSSDGSITSALGELYELPREDVYAMDIREDPNLGIAGDSFTFELIQPDEPLPFEDSSLSLITTNMVLHHIEDPMQTIQEIYRVLEPGAYYVVTEHDWMNTDDHTWFLDVVHGLYSTVLNDPIEMTPEEFVNDHFARYRPISEWKSMIESVGFELISERAPRSDDRQMRSHSAVFMKPL